MLIRALIAITLLLGGVSPARAQSAPTPNVRVGVDLRVELFAIVWRLAGSHVYNMGTLQPYVSEIDQHFGPHRGHRAVGLARELLESGVDFSAVMTLAIHTSGFPELEQRVPLDAAEGVLAQPGMSAAQRARFAADVRRFLEAARDFISEVRADEFFSAHQTLYDSAGARMRRLIETHANPGWFDEFFGTPPSGDFIVVPLLATSEVNFGPVLPGIGVEPERYAIISTRNNAVDSAGYPTYPPRLVRTLVHELNHSYVNELLAAHADRFAESGPIVFEAVAEPMRANGYTEWRVMLAEALVDGAVARYVLAHQGAEAARAVVAREREEGHVYMHELFELLGEYEANRSRYPTLDAFMPRIAEYFDTLPERLDELVRP